MKRLLLAFVALALCLSAGARTHLRRTFTASNGVTLPYQIVYPEGFTPAEQYPLLLFLHGWGAHIGLYQNIFDLPQVPLW